MTKSELIELLHRRFPNFTMNDCKFTVESILDAIGDRLAEGGRVEIRGFGSFSIHTKPPRVGRNPKTGDRVDVPAKHVPHFKPGKEMKESVDYKI